MVEQVAVEAAKVEEEAAKEVEEELAKEKAREMLEDGLVPREILAAVDVRTTLLLPSNMFSKTDRFGGQLANGNWNSNLVACLFVPLYR